MREVVIQIPTYEAEQNIEIDVHINGRKIKKKYRVEIIAASRSCSNKNAM